jgi:hypothetical protein
MLTSGLPTAATTALLAILAGTSAAAPTTADATPAFRPFQPAVPLNASLTGSGALPEGALAKRDEPNIYMWGDSYSCNNGADSSWTAYYGLGNGCYTGIEFDSFSPTNNPGCVIEAWDNDAGCYGNVPTWSASANGECVPLVQYQSNGNSFYYTTHTFSVRC